jgi:exonuclease III
VIYGKKPEERFPELKAIADWMAEWAEQTTIWDQNLVVLGDFNIDRHGELLWQAFASTGLTVPPVLDAVPRSIFPSDADRLDKYYDQIAWFETGKKRQLNLDCAAGGSIDFVPHLYRDLGMKRQDLQHRVSDHYPLWVEFMRRP